MIYMLIDGFICLCYILLFLNGFLVALLLVGLNIYINLFCRITIISYSGFKEIAMICLSYIYLSSISRRSSIYRESTRQSQK